MKRQIVVFEIIYYLIETKNYYSSMFKMTTLCAIQVWEEGYTMAVATPPSRATKDDFLGIEYSDTGTAHMEEVLLTIVEMNSLIFFWYFVDFCVDY